MVSSAKFMDLGMCDGCQVEFQMFLCVCVCVCVFVNYHHFEVIGSHTLAQVLYA